MQIVTDSGVDLFLSIEQVEELDINIVPLTVTLDGESYREGIDIENSHFYRLLAETDSLPVTSQPAAGEFADALERADAFLEVAGAFPIVGIGASGRFDGTSIALRPRDVGRRVEIVALAHGFLQGGNRRSGDSERGPPERLCGR